MPSSCGEVGIKDRDFLAEAAIEARSADQAKFLARPMQAPGHGAIDFSKVRFQQESLSIRPAIRSSAIGRMRLCSADMAIYRTTWRPAPE